MTGYPFKPSIFIACLLLGLCLGCTPTAADKPIRPGDEITGYVITQGAAEGVEYTTLMKCRRDESTNTESCDFPVGTTVNVGAGITGDFTRGKNLDETWLETTYEMEIEGHPVDLQAFGSTDIYHPHAGKIRVWNVAIVGDHPGKIAAHSSGTIGGEAFEYNAALTFTQP